MPIFDKIASLVGGNIADGVAKVISTVKADPTVVLQNQTELEKIKLEMSGKIIDATTAEIQASADNIQAEAKSQSWLPRNVRPLLLLMWGSAITFNVFVAILAHLHAVNWTPTPLDPWVYKLVAIGYTGYTGFRTWEKLKDADN